MKNAKDMRAIALKAQKHYKRYRFKSTLKEIKKRAKEGDRNYTTRFHRDEFTDTDINTFVDYLTSKGYKVFVDGVHIMRIQW